MYISLSSRLDKMVLTVSSPATTQTVYATTAVPSYSNHLAVTIAKSNTSNYGLSCTDKAGNTVAAPTQNIKKYYLLTFNRNDLMQGVDIPLGPGDAVHWEGPSTMPQQKIYDTETKRITTSAFSKYFQFAPTEYEASLGHGGQKIYYMTEGWATNKSGPVAYNYNASIKPTT